MNQKINKLMRPLFTTLTVIVITLYTNYLNAQNKWDRCYTKGDVTISIFNGWGELNSLLVYSENNIEGLQGENKPNMSGPLGIQMEYHSKDNFITGITYSYISAKSGTWFDDNLDVYYHQLTAHQFTAKSGYGWFNHRNSGTMLYSAIYYGLRLSNTNTEYPEYLMKSNPEPFPVEVSSTASHLTLIGFKGRFLKDAALGLDIELGVGCKGFLSGGINYTFN